MDWDGLMDKAGKNQSRVFPASFPGRCAACDGGFDEGDPVRYDDDELVHEGCES